MLVEQQNVRQIEGEGTRRWFFDQDFDLIVWYSDNKPTGFQLCYDKQSKEHALTWKRDEGFLHSAIDDGESAWSSPRTPVLVPDGHFDVRRVADRFSKVSATIDPEVVHLVQNTLSSYPGV